MANTTRLNLLGPPAWRRGADGAALPWQRPSALLAIVACHPAGIGRDTLAGLMRPDADEGTARAHLRRNLHRARALLPVGDALHADNNRLRWIGECDVVEFLAAVDACEWKRAIALHGAPLLAGNGALGDAPIDDWVAAERERLLGRLRVALVARLAEPSCDDAERAVGITRLIDLDPMDETAFSTSAVTSDWDSNSDPAASTSSCCAWSTYRTQASSVRILGRTSSSFAMPTASIERVASGTFDHHSHLESMQVNISQGSAGPSSLPPALQLLEAQRRVTRTFGDLGKAQRLRDEGLLALDEYERCVLAHAVAERQLNDLLRWLNATE